MLLKIRYKKSVFQDLKNIGLKEGNKIVIKLEKKLKKNPNEGTPLEGKFKGLFKLRIGKYRVIYTRTDREVLILRIGQRKNVYKKSIFN